MKVLHSVDELLPGLRYALAIGTFDGVHRGHAKVIEALTVAARAKEATSVVLTFDPHPNQLLHDSAPPLVCDVAERLELFEHLGVETAVVQKFDRHFADQSPEEFLERVTRRRNLVALVLTDESAFGRGRAAGLAAVRELAGQFGFEVVEVPRLATSGAAVSSTRLRTLLAEGRLAQVQRLLGRRYAVVGTVVKGDQRGRALGFPTANLQFERPVALPRDGIYAVRVSWNADDPRAKRQRRDGVASLGTRPTFENDGARILEVHLFDFDGDLYGHRLRVEFVRRLRSEKRFSSASDLISQMTRDAARARSVLAALP